MRYHQEHSVNRAVRIHAQIESHFASNSRKTIVSPQAGYLKEKNLDGLILISGMIKKKKKKHALHIFFEKVTEEAHFQQWFSRPQRHLPE